MDIHSLGNTWPDGMLVLSIAVIVAYDRQALTVRPLPGSPPGPTFASSGFVGIKDTVIEGRAILRVDWLWLKVGDPIMNEDGTQCYPVIEKHGHADVKIGAIALYVSGDNPTS